MLMQVVSGTGSSEPGRQGMNLPGAIQAEHSIAAVWTGDPADLVTLMSQISAFVWAEAVVIAGRKISAG